jgi:uncharacterized cysteine cluster protein YcgN (CxxCxxCC family)
MGSAHGPGAPFWQKTALEQLRRRQWELLCDGCGRCCLQKLTDGKTGKTSYTSVSCYLLDIEHCRCRDYRHRTQRVKDCVVLTPDRVRSYRWLPVTCAYRLVAEGKPLMWWHPLISGDPATVHDAGISVRGRAISEEWVHPEDLDDYLGFG